MKTIVLVIGLLAVSFSAYGFDRESRYGNHCSWSNSGKKYFDCEDKPFVYGYVHCDDGFSEKIFCREKDANPISKCATDDQNKQTRRCRDKLLIPITRGPEDSTGRSSPSKKPKLKKQKHDLPFVSECSDGVVQGHSYPCSNGRYYYFNEEACGIDPDLNPGPLFCDSNLKNKNRECYEDINNRDTRGCYEELFGIKWPYDDSPGAQQRSRGSR